MTEWQTEHINSESIPMMNTAKVMDTVGGVMYVEYKNGEVRECQK